MFSGIIGLLLTVILGCVALGMLLGVLFYVVYLVGAFIIFKQTKGRF